MLFESFWLPFRENIELVLSIVICVHINYVLLAPSGFGQVLIRRQFLFRKMVARHPIGSF